MDIKKVSQLDNLVTPEAPKSPGIAPGGPSFAETLGQLQKQPPAANPLRAKAAGSLDAASDVRFSNHAVERMMSRGIQFGKEDLKRLDEAIDRAAAKGSKDSLILMNDSALIVSVKNKTVVTVMDKNALRENVFTNIDSTIVM